MRNLDLNTPVTTSVICIEEWNHTGILLKSDSIYKLEVIPADQVWYDGHKLPPFTADGKMLPYLALWYPFIRMPFVKWFALLGCIDKKRSTYFKIGTVCDNYSPEIDGELICFANDARRFYKHNNEGQMELTVTKIGSK